jgi:hypothetical protein
VLLWRMKSPSRHTRFFNFYSEQFLYEAQALIAEEFGVFLSLDVPLKQLLFMNSSALNKRTQKT